MHSSGKKTLQHYSKLRMKKPTIHVIKANKDTISIYTVYIEYSFFFTTHKHPSNHTTVPACNNNTIPKVNASKKPATIIKQ